MLLLDGNNSRLLLFNNKQVVLLDGGKVNLLQVNHNRADLLLDSHKRNVLLVGNKKGQTCYWRVTPPPCQTLYNIKVPMYTYSMRLEKLKQRSREANNGKIYFNKKINRGDN